jgi:hypothetical protein
MVPDFTGVSSLFPRQLKHQSVELEADFHITASRLGAREVRSSFAGSGPNIVDAIDNAISKFAASSLHFLLATHEDQRLGGEQVEYEDWGPFRVCVGPLLRQWSTETAVDFEKYFDALKALILEQRMSNELHWFELFVGHGQALMGYDALLDSRPWAPAAKLTREWPWPQVPVDRAYALRNFIVLMPKRTVQ